MIPKIGDKIKITDLPSYKNEAKPDLPVIATVSDVTDYKMIIVNISGKNYELYEDDGYEVLV